MHSNRDLNFGQPCREPSKSRTDLRLIKAMNTLNSSSKPKYNNFNDVSIIGNTNNLKPHTKYLYYLYFNDTVIIRRRLRLNWNRLKICLKLSAPPPHILTNRPIISRQVLLQVTQRCQRVNALAALWTISTTKNHVKVITKSNE